MAQPFIQLHEYAHFAGYALEQDADIIAYWSGWLSPDPVWQYSAWLEFWMSVKAPSEVYQQLSNAIIDDMKCYQDFLTSQPRWSINTLAWKVYEVHLKSQGVTEGLGSYQLGEAMALTSYQNWLQPKSLR
jgi:hypothetical protein